MQTEGEILKGGGGGGSSLVVGDEFPSCNNKTAASKMVVVAAAAAAAAVVEAEQILRAGFYVSMFPVRRVGFQVACFFFCLSLCFSLENFSFFFFMLHYSVL